MGKIFGGSKSKSHTENQAYGDLSNAFGNSLDYTNQGGNLIASLLGVGGDTSGFDNFLNSSGYQFVLDSGSKALRGSRAATGGLRSGMTDKALINYGQEVGKSYLKDYMGNALNLANLGLGAGGVLAQAGGVSDSTSKQKNGLGGLLGGIGSRIAMSDRRLKKDISYLRTLDNGLNVYEYHYVDNSGPYIGVMADEVERILPEALGPVIDGYKSVDYSKIGELI